MAPGLFVVAVAVVGTAFTKHVQKKAARIVRAPTTLHVFVLT